MFFLPLGRNERKRAAEDFSRGPTESSLRSLIPEQDLAGSGEHDNRKRGGRDKCLPHLLSLQKLLDLVGFLRHTFTVKKASRGSLLVDRQELVLVTGHGH